MCNFRRSRLTTNFLQDFLSNITNQLSASCFHTNHVSEDKKLPQPCCSKSPDFGRNEGCSIIHLGFNGTRIARCAADVFYSFKSPNGLIRRFFMTKDRTTHLEFPAAQACGQQGERELTYMIIALFLSSFFGTFFESILDSSIKNSRNDILEN